MADPGGRSEEEGVLEHLPRFRQFSEALDSALSSFEKAREWADLIKVRSARASALPLFRPFVRPPRSR